MEERNLLEKIEELKRQVEEANARNIDRNAVPRDVTDSAQSSQSQNMTPVPQTWKGKGHQPPQRPPVPNVPMVQPRPPSQPVVSMQVEVNTAQNYYDGWSTNHVGQAGLFPAGIQTTAPTPAADIPWVPTHPKATPNAWNSHMEWELSLIHI